MKRIDTPNRALDLFGAGKDGFRNGNLALSQLPTEFNADWPNGIQEELLAIVEAAGIAPNGGVLNQVLLALRAAGVFETAAQFDSTTKAATTAFLKRHGLQASGITTVNATGALTVAHAGGTVLIDSAGATTQTLPAANALAAGSQIELFNINSGVATVQRAGADTVRVGSTTVNSLSLGAGDTLKLQCNGVNGWVAVGGSAQLASSNVFRSSSGASGYLALPGGLILQWMTVSVAGAYANYALPIAFPSGSAPFIAAAVANQSGTSAVQCCFDKAGSSATNARLGSINVQNNAAIAANYTIFFIGN